VLVERALLLFCAVFDLFTERNVNILYYRQGTARMNNLVKTAVWRQCAMKITWISERSG